MPEYSDSRSAAGFNGVMSLVIRVGAMRRSEQDSIRPDEAEVSFKSFPRTALRRWWASLRPFLRNGCRLAVAVLAVAIPVAAQPGIPPEAGQILALANQARAAQGAGPLKWDPALAEAARQHCLRMAEEGPIAHRYGGEPDVSARASQSGAHFDLIEENVALAATPMAVHEGWMHSPEHRANLLNPQVNRAGIAVVASRGVLYAVADYTRQVQALTPEQAEAEVARVLRSHGVRVSNDARDARAACAMDRGLPHPLAGPEPGFLVRWQDSDLHHLPPALESRLASFGSASVGNCPAQDTSGSFTVYRMAVLLYAGGETAH